MDLFLREAADRIGADDVLRKIDRLMNWQSFLPILKRGLKRTGIGPQGYDPLVLFKCLLIGQWHGLSDPKLERALKVRLDFMIFCGLDLHAPVPDETTHCRFRNALVRGGVYDDLLSEVCRQIEACGLKLKEAEAALIDATMIDGAKAQRVLADKAYASKANRDMLRSRHRDGIMRKAVRGRPLRASEKRFNKLISKRRFRVEQCFGTMKRLFGKRLFGKRLFGLHRARYFGLAKTHAHLAMAAIGQNLLKAANKIKINPQAQAIA